MAFATLFKLKLILKHDIRGPRAHSESPVRVRTSQMQAKDVCTDVILGHRRREGFRRPREYTKLSESIPTGRSVGLARVLKNLIDPISENCELHPPWLCRPVTG